MVLLIFKGPTSTPEFVAELLRNLGGTLRGRFCGPGKVPETHGGTMAVGRTRCLFEPLDTAVVQITVLKFQWVCAASVLQC